MSQGSELLARHVSPDGALTLRVDRMLEGGVPLVVVGFEESGWHFHPTEEEAGRLVEAVLTDRVVILIAEHEGEVSIELLDDLPSEIDVKPPGMTYGFRTWTRNISFEDLIDGKVPHTPYSRFWNWLR